jgi:hypothetical protein
MLLLEQIVKLQDKKKEKEGNVKKGEKNERRKRNTVSSRYIQML